MILIHGFISSNLMWSGVLLQWHAQASVVCADLGYGYSEKPYDAQYNRVPGAGRDCLMDRLEIGKAVIVVRLMAVRWLRCWRWIIRAGRETGLVAR